MKEKSLKERLERMEAVHEIQNIMGRYEYLLSAAMGEELVNLFAGKSPDVSVSIGDWGVYRGIEGIRRNFVDGFSQYVPKVGWMAECDLTTPVIEVAGDGKTARGAWSAPGFETHFDERTGKPKGSWSWNKYACDFIKEDGKWKIWHLFCFLTFNADYDKCWTETADIPEEVRINCEKTRTADLPNPYPRYTPYKPNTRRELLPAYPKPYETFDASVDWIDPAGIKK
jgi:hypothetical protein